MSLSTNQCCAIRSLGMSKQTDGTISVTVTALAGQASDIAVNIINDYGSDYQITSWRDEPPLRTVTAISKSASDTKYKLKMSGIFKSVPVEIYNLYKSGLYHTSIVPVTYEPDAERFIKPSEDIYGAEGWTVREIFDELNINIRIPGKLNYHVYSLNVQKNAPILSLLRTLFPIPGILIYYYNNKFYVTLPTSNPINTASGLCSVLGTSSNTTEYQYEVIGQQGEPLYIDENNVERVESSNLSLGILPASVDMTYNLVGGVFCINERQVSSVSITSQIIEEYFNEFNRSYTADAEDNHTHETTP